MANRGYKLQEFVAHAGNVNCLSLGKKNCRVFITGGDDQKVNLWSVGKPTSLMSLCGHTSPVESAAFDSAEVLVVAGSSSGAIKLWDLEETKMVRTLTGHRSYCTAVEFHPFGEFFASGSMDTNLKIWDIRKKGCIHTYKGHTRGISTIRFTPDGRWVVSGGFDNVVKVWDLTAGKLLHDFKFHEGHIRSIEFHPLEFLLATGSADKTVKFWDLETFEMIGSARREATGVRSIAFHPDGRTLFCGLDNSLKVYSWEPVICHDSIDMGWSTLGDLCIHDGKLLGGAYYENSVAVWVADVSLIEPYGTRLSLEQHSHSEHKSNSQESVLEKHESSVKSKSNVRSTTPDSDSKDFKTIYVDRVNSVAMKTTEGVNSFTSKTRGGVNSITPKAVDTTDVPKVVHPKVDTVEVPKVAHPKVDTVEVPKVVHPKVDTTGAPKIVHSIVDNTDVPKVVHLKVDTTDVPKVVHPKIDTTDVHKVVHSSDSKEISSIRVQKRRSSAKTNASSINRTLVLPSIVPRDGPDGKDSVVSRRQSIASTKGSSVISTKPPHTRRLSTTHFDTESMSVSLQSLPSANMRSSLGSKKESNLRNRLVTDENARDSSEDKPSNIRTLTEKLDRISTIKTVTEKSDRTSTQETHSNIRTVAEKSDRTSTQETHSNIRTVTEKSDRTSTQEKQSNINTATEKSDRTSTRATTPGDEAQNSSSKGVTSVKVVNGVAVVRGRTRSLVERFERKEKVDADETYLPDMASLAAEPPEKQDSNVASVPDEKQAFGTLEKTTSQKSDEQIVMKEPSSLDDNSVIENLMQNHDVLLSTFRSRLTKLQVVRHFWERNDVKGAINAVRKLPDHSVQADVIGALIGRTEIVTLELFSCLLPVLLGLLESKAERHASVSLEMLLKLVAVFGSLVRSTVSAPRGVGVDLHQEERLDCCRQCFTHLQMIQNIVPELIKRGGVVARYSQQLNLVLQQT